MTAAQAVPTCSRVFGPLVVRYDARVLTPRPWTLLQSRWAAELASHAAAGPILELCAGAGQIGLAAAVLTGRPLVQVEADPVAAGYAVTNAALAGLADRVEVRNGQIDTVLTETVLSDTMLAAGEQFPIILADPPYLPSADVARWPDDPASAIDGGVDGLDVVRVCLRVAREHLAPGGALLLQVAGETQALAVIAHVERTADLGLTHCETRHHDRSRAVMLLTGGVPGS